MSCIHLLTAAGELAMTGHVAVQSLVSFVENLLIILLRTLICY